MHLITDADIFKNKDIAIWDSIRKQNPAICDVRVHRVNFEKINFSDFNIAAVYFENCFFKACHFEKCDLRQSQFHNCNFEASDLSASISGPKDNSQATVFANCDFRECILKKSKINNTSFSRVNFLSCELSGSDFKSSFFFLVSFLNSNLSNCNFRWAEFSEGITWDGARFNRRTDFYSAVFQQNKYPIDNDKSDKIKISWKDWPTWEGVQFLNSIPIFQASFLVFIIALFLANVIVTLNSNHYVTNIIKYPIPLPRQIMFVLGTSFYLFVGAFIYRLSCPQVVQDFTESEWVIDHNRARPRYKEFLLQKYWWRMLCFAFLIAGGGTGIWILLCRILDVILSPHHNCLFCHVGHES